MLAVISDSQVLRNQISDIPQRARREADDRLPLRHTTFQSRQSFLSEWQREIVFSGAGVFLVLIGKRQCRQRSAVAV
jgi:hypothetical protein